LTWFGPACWWVAGGVAVAALAMWVWHLIDKHTNDIGF
jgi:hypothetical protein